MKYFKHTICFLLSLALVFSLSAPSFAAPAQEEKGDGWYSYFQDHLEPGNFVIYGSFEGQELVWYVCETDGDEALLYCVTPFLKGEFDASINYYVRTGPGWQVRYGSSSWRTSDVRYFLNTGAEDLEYRDECFDYSGLSGGTGGGYDSETQNVAPSYAQYDGFLNKDNFLEEEVALLNPTVQNTLVSFIDPVHIGSGTPDLREYGYYGAEDAHTLVDAGYSHVVTEDYMFLFSSEQYHRYEEAVEWTDYRMDEHWSGGAYWLRDAPKYYSSTAWLTYLWVGMYQNFSGASNSYYWGHNDAMESSAYKYADDSIQIRPACYIATDYIEELSGEGSYEDPYRMTIDPSVLDREEYLEGDIYREHPQNLTLTVYTTIQGPEGSQQVYRLCEGAKVKVNNDVTYKTDANGQVTIPYPRGGAEISYNGYSTRKLTGAQLEGTPEVYLQKKSDDPVLNGVWVDNVDILHKEYTLDLMKSGSHYVRVEVDWGDSSCDTLILRQSAEIVDLAPNGARITWSDHFDVSDTIELVAIDADGDTRRAPLKIKVDTVLPSQLNGFKVSFGDGLSFTLGESAGPFLTGTEIKADIYSPVKFECSLEDGKAYLVFGVQGDFGATEGGKLKPKETVFGLKKLTDNLSKNVGDFAKQQREIQNFMKKNDMAIGRGSGSLNVSCSFDLLGFMEGYLNSKGEIIWLDSGFIIGGSGGFEYGCPMAVGTVPLFFEMGMKNEVMLQGHFRSDPQKQIFSPDAEVRWTTTVSGGLGVGIKDALSISGGVEGKLMTKWEINFDDTDYFELRTTLGAYFKGNLAIFEVKPDIPPAVNKLLIEYPSSRAMQKAPGDEEAAEGIVIDVYDPDSYALREVTETKWQGGHATRNGNAALVTGLSDSADPQLIRLSNGKLALLYVGQNPEYTDANGQQLYVTTFDGSSWSAPVLFLDNSMADAYPYVANVNGDPMIAWMEFGALTEDSTLADATTRIMAGDISSDGTFSGLPFSVYDGAALAYQPIICGTRSNNPRDTKLTAVWQGNTDGDWFGAEKNVIYTADHGSVFSWNSPKAVYEDLGMITSLTAAYVGKQLHIAWAMDTDGDIYTTEDVEIFVDGVQLTDNTVAESNLCYAEGVLYWYADGKIYADGQVILASDEITLSPIFRLVENRAILFTVENGLYTTLYASWCNEGVWSAPVALTNGTEYIYDYAAALDQDGKLNVALCTKTVTPENVENPYGEGTLQVLTVENGCDLELRYAETDASRYVSGKDQVFDLCVENRGNVTASGLLVEIVDNASGYTVEHTQQTPVAPGESVEFSCVMAIASATKVKELTIRVTPLEAEDIAPENNETVLTLRWDDLTVENASWGYRPDEKPVIYGSIVNRSYNTAENITVSLRRENPKGEVLQTQTVEKLEALGLQGVAFVVETELDAVYCITVEIEDDNNSNNYAHVMVNSVLGAVNQEQGGDETSCTHEKTELRNAREATCTENGYTGDTYCLLCGSLVQSGNSIPARGHNYWDGVCIRCGTEDPNWTGEPFVNPFIDVKENDYFYDPVLWAVQNGITNGTTPTTFSPYDPCTRGQIVTFLWRAFGSPEPERDENPFTDVPENIYYYKAILWAVEQGITTGTSATTFSPESTCTRGQVATFLWRACGKPAPEGGENPFTDVPQTVYYYEPILWAVENGITNGTGGGKFSPEDSCTRGQIVTFLYRALAE